MDEWGQALFHTIHKKLAGLRNGTIVLPAHSAGPNEIGDDGVVSARLGDLRRSAPELHLVEASDFVDAMRAAVKEPPASYALVIRANLGAETPELEKVQEWEMGKNQCAAGAVS